MQMQTMPVVHNEVFLAAMMRRVCLGLCSKSFWAGSLALGIMRMVQGGCLGIFLLMSSNEVGRDTQSEQQGGQDRHVPKHQ